MDPRLGGKIAEGGCAEVYEWGGREQIVKVAKPNTRQGAMKLEYDNTLTAWEHGLPAARALEFLELDGRPSIVFERIHGASLMEKFMHQMIQSAGKDEVGLHSELVEVTARLLSQVHSKSNIGLSSQREMMIHTIRYPDYLSPAEKEAVVQWLERLPVKNQVCHGDPNPGNIMYREGEAVFIDWMDASIGNPEADAAEYIVMIRYAVLPEALPLEAVRAFDAVREDIVQAFCQEYERLTGITYEEIQPWIVPIAARKLCADAISEEEKGLLLQEIRSRLKSVENYES